MNTKNLFRVGLSALLFSFALGFVSCRPLRQDNIVYQRANPHYGKLKILYENNPAPDGILLGTSNYGDNNGMTKTENCTMTAISRVAEEYARSIGANVIHYTKVVPPSWGTTCYTVTAMFYFVEDKK